MKVTLLKKSGKKEVINRVEFPAMIAAIRDGVVVKSVKMTREVYNLMEKHRQPDGQIATNWEGGIVLPRVCFAAEYINRKGEQQMMAYNGLVVLEVNDLKTYESAVEIRELAKKLPETMACFLGGSGRSVKIICRGEMFEKAEVGRLKADVGGKKDDGRNKKDDGRGKKDDVRGKKDDNRLLPKGEAEIRQFHLNLYNTARRAYQNQFGFDIEFLRPRDFLQS